MVKPSTLGRLVGRHALVGASCAVLNIAIIHIGVAVARIPYIAAAVATCFITIPIAYFALRGFGFRMKTPSHPAEFARFLAQQLAQFLIGLILLILGVEWLQLHPTISMAAATCLLWVFAFLSQWLWVFRDRSVLTASQTRTAIAPSTEGVRMVVVTPFFPAHGGGLERVAYEIADRLAAGNRISWVSSDIDPAPDSLSDKVACIPMRTNNIVERATQLPYPIWSPFSLPKLWMAIGRANVVHIHEHIYFPSIAAVLISKLRRRPVILTQHMGALVLPRRWMTPIYNVGARFLGALIFRLANRVVFISENVTGYFSRNDAANTRIIFNGVDTSRFRHLDDLDRTSLRQALRLPTDRRIVLFVGRFVRKKGIHRIMELARLTPDATFLFVGSGPESPDTDVPNVVLAGRVEHDQLADYYRASDLLILPSSGEGFPLVVQEALCCGTAVLSTTEVATACPDAAHLIRHREVPRGDASTAEWQIALAETLGDQEYLDDRAQRATLALSLWSWQKCAARYAELIREVIECEMER